jgi:hypothetical protein
LKGAGPLRIVNGTLWKEQHIQVTGICLFPENDGIVMQDGVPCHTVEVLEWPRNRPDMNPIEKIWKEMKDCQ